MIDTSPVCAGRHHSAPGTDPETDRNHRFRGPALIACLVLVAAVVSMQAHADHAAHRVLAASTGEWVGELYYLDYQSGQRFGIPMRVDASMTPDGATLVRRLTFTDPGTLVHAINLATVEPGGQRLVEAYFRERKGQHFTYEVTEARFDGETDWRLAYEHDGRDDDRPARIRHTMTRKGNSLTSTKEVRFLDDDDDGAYLLRNGTELELATPDAGATGDDG